MHVHDNQYTVPPQNMQVHVTKLEAYLFWYQNI